MGKLLSDKEICELPEGTLLNLGRRRAPARVKVVGPATLWGRQILTEVVYNGGLEMGWDCRGQRLARHLPDGTRCWWVDASYGPSLCEPRTWDELVATMRHYVK